MKLVIESPVIVITPSVGTDFLIKAVDSVLKQTYLNVKHLIVADGQEYEAAIRGKINLHFPEDDRIIVTSTPYNTGAGGWNGQRIYAAYPHLLTQDYILFLDEDNWYEPDHVRSLVDVIERRNYDWAYSLRNVYTKDEKFVDKDCCESTGVWPIYWSLDKPEKEKQYIIDTSSYCYKRDFIKNTCHLWHNGIWGEDRRYYHAVTQIMKHINFGTTGLHTLNYRLDDDIDRKYGNINFFSEGNKIVKQHYGGEYPWLKT